MAGLFGKEHKRGVLKGIEGKGGGYGKNALLPPLSRDQNRGGEAGRRWHRFLTPWGTAASGARGKERGE